MGILKQLLERKLKGKIQRLIEIDYNYEIFLLSSGRSALYTFFSSYNQPKSQITLLLPNYLCNVVEMSARIAGIQNIVFYSIGDNLLPDRSDLLSKINVYSPDIVVFAPIFGSYGNTFYQIIECIDRVDNRPLIVFDFAQDLTIKLPSIVDIGITSFNKKSVNGHFGGALIVKKNLLNKCAIKTSNIAITQEVYYFQQLLSNKLSKIPRKTMNFNYSVQQDEKYEYSYCKSELYTITNNSMSVISLIIAILELNKIHQYEAIREENWIVISDWLQQYAGIKVIETERIIHSPYVPVRVDDLTLIEIIYPTLHKNGIKLKYPYALNLNPDESLKCNIFAIEKGFEKLKSLEDINNHRG